MSCLALSDKYLAISKGLHVDCFNKNDSTHTYFKVSSKPDGAEDDYITDIVISFDNKYLAAITCSSKQLLVCGLPLSEDIKTVTIPRSASKIRFTSNNLNILVADKSGDVLLYKLETEPSGTKLLGHLSLLLDVLQTNDGKYIISSDRDEKIRVSCFPNTYNIATYCLGHKEFVSHIELLPHNEKYLTSSSGDGTIKCWDFESGRLAYSIDACLDIEDSGLKENFAKIMDSEGVEVTTLPVFHYSVTLLNEESSLLAVAVHSYNKLLIYSLHTINNKFSHKKELMLTIDKFPTALKFDKQHLYLYDDAEATVIIMNIVNNQNKISLEYEKKIQMFDNQIVNFETKSNIESIKVLYKRKFDNVQEYHERKRQRLERTLQ